MTRNIAIVFVFDGEILTETISRDASCEAVRSLWTQLTNRPAQLHCFLLGAGNGPELPQDGDLLPQMIDPDAPTISIFVYCLRTITASVLGVPEVTLELSLTPLTSLQQLITQVTRQLHIDDDRRIQLKVDDRVLSPEITMLDQLSPEDSLEVDLELRVDIVSMSAFSSHPIIGDDHCPISLNFEFPKEIKELALNSKDLLAPPLFEKEEDRRVRCFVSEATNVLLMRKNEAETESAREYIEANMGERREHKNDEDETEEQEDFALDEEEGLNQDKTGQDQTEHDKHNQETGEVSDQEGDRMNSDETKHPQENDYNKDDEDESKDSEDVEQRILVVNEEIQEISLDASVADLFDGDILMTWNATVFLESRIRVLVDNRITAKQQTMSLWPSSKVSDLLTSEKDENQYVMLDGGLANPELSLWAAGVYNDAVLILTQLVSLQVVDSKGNSHKLNTDYYQAGVELHQQLSRFEGSNHRFRVWFDDRCLSRETRTLKQLGLTSQSEVHIFCRTRNVEVTKKEQCLATFQDVKEGTQFHEFLVMVKKALKAELPDDTTFQCKCGRVFSNQCCRRRTFPVRCCDDPVLSLEMRIPENQHFRGRWTTCDYRLPSGGTSEVLDKVLRLATADRGREWQELEEALLRSLFTIEEATKVSIAMDERLDLLLQLSDDIAVPWSVRPTDSVCQALTELERITHQTVTDVAVHDDRCLKVRERPIRTFKDFGMVQGQRLTRVRSTSNEGVERNCSTPDKDGCLHLAEEMRPDEAVVTPHEEESILPSERTLVTETFVFPQSSALEKLRQVADGYLHDRQKISKIESSSLLEALEEAKTEVQELLRKAADADPMERGDLECSDGSARKTFCELLSELKAVLQKRIGVNDRHSEVTFPSDPMQKFHACVQDLLKNFGFECIDTNMPLALCTLLIMASLRGHADVARCLIKAGCNIEAQGEFKITPLMIASKNDHADVARCLIEAGCNIEVQGESKMTPLMIALELGHANVARCLIEAGCNIEAQDESKRTPLMIASLHGRENSARCLIKAGCNIEAKDKDKATALMYASQHGHADVVQFFIRTKCNIDARDKNETTALMHASQCCRVDVVQYLIKAGCNIEAKDKNGTTPLMIASGRGHVEVAKLLIDNGCSVNAQNNEKKTSLMFAAELGKAQVAKLLIEAKCDVDMHDDFKRTALMFTCTASVSQYGKRNYEDVARYLIKAKCDINAQDAARKTSLMLASQVGCENIARLLIETGCNTEAHDNNGTTALMIACAAGREGTAKILIEGGANINAQDSHKNTPLMFASIKGHVKVVDLLITKGCCADAQNTDNETSLLMASESGHEKVVGLLIEAMDPISCNIDTGDVHKRTPLMLAAGNGHADIVRLLIGNGGNIHAKDEDKRTPLMYASQFGCANIVRYLIEAGCALDAQDKDNRTPLMIASEHGHVDIVQILMERRCNIDARDKDNRTPLMISLKYGHTHIARLLIDAGCKLKSRDKRWKTAADYAKKNSEILEMLKKAKK